MTLQASLKNYTIGFVLSVILTLLAYGAVVNHWSTGWVLIALIISLAIVQLVIQLVFFLHLGNETKPRWNLLTFLFMMMVLLIIVIGSLWIMNNLNYNMMMSPEEMDTYMMQQSNKGF